MVYHFQSMSVAHMPKNVLSGFVDLKGNGQQQYGPAATSAAQNKAGLQPKMNIKNNSDHHPTHTHTHIHHIILYIYVYNKPNNRPPPLGFILGYTHPPRNGVKWIPVEIWGERFTSLDVGTFWLGTTPQHYRKSKTVNFFHYKNQII